MNPGPTASRAHALLAALVLFALLGALAVWWHALSREPAAVAQVESCRNCHAGVAGLGDYHAPERIGCSACHRGEPSRADAAGAHAGLVRIPGELADIGRTCGQAGCHDTIAHRVERSIMTTMAGVVAVNRRVLGEPVGSLPVHAGELGTSAADSHLRELCISCHLGQRKEALGPIGQTSRGGGCNACHLVYGDEAKAALARYEATPASQRTSAPAAHPSLTLNPGNEHCFGCHSRSSRIATSYEGWHEIRGAPSQRADPKRLRRLDDGRWFERVLPDVHHERGLDCIDCHIASELMGSGAAVARKSDQVRVACEDCHAAKLASVGLGALDAESVKLLALRRWRVAPEQRFGTTRHGDALINVFVDADGRGQLVRKRTGDILPLKAPAAVCTQGGGHARLTCASCHSAWAPRCTSCHTEFDPADEGFDHLAQQWVRGTWNESSGPFEATLPTLGVRLRRDAAGREHGSVETFVPGMIMTFDRNRDAGKAPDVIFRRLYAVTFAHTIRREARSCRSCHADPVALGYGKGSLRYVAAGQGGAWRFRPYEKPSPHDGLPADAWIGFLGERGGMLSTRDDVRPFTLDEQRRILRVGACLVCHAGDSAPMRAAIVDFPAALARRTARCSTPW